MLRDTCMYIDIYLRIYAHLHAGAHTLGNDWQSIGVFGFQNK